MRQQLQIRCPMDCNDCHQPNCSRSEQSFIIVGRHFVQETHRKNATGQLVVYCFTNMSSTNHTIHNRLWNPSRWAAMHHSESRHVNIGPIANKSFTAPDGRHRIPYLSECIEMCKRKFNLIVEIEGGRIERFTCVVLSTLADVAMRLTPNPNPSQPPCGAFRSLSAGHPSE